MTLDKTNDPLTVIKAQLDRIEGAVKEWTFEPTEEDHACCSKCNQAVHVEDGLEWEDGDICYSCCQEWWQDMPPNEITKLTKSLRVACEALEAYTILPLDMSHVADDGLSKIQEIMGAGNG